LLMPNKLCWFVALAWMCAQQCGASSHGDSDAEADSREEVFELSDYAIALHRVSCVRMAGTVWQLPCVDSVSMAFVGSGRVSQHRFQSKLHVGFL